MIRYFAESVFAQDRLAVEAEQRAWDPQGGDRNQEVRPSCCNCAACSGDAEPPRIQRQPTIRAILMRGLRMSSAIRQLRVNLQRVLQLQRWLAFSSISQHIGAIESVVDNVDTGSVNVWSGFFSISGCQPEEKDGKPPFWTPASRHWIILA